MDNQPQTAVAQRRRARRTRGGRLHVEALESRRLLHASHEYDDPVIELPALADEADDVFVAAAVHPLSSVPPLASLPGAADTLYLDFDGYFEADWGTHHNITTPAFDRDGDATTFSDNELARIESIWAYMAEDYAPFNLNVTTIEPPSFANGVALRVVIGGKGNWTGGTYGGIAYVDSFTNSLPNSVYVFPKNLANGNAKFTADAASHEAGHAFGLEHQSLYNSSGKLVDEYYDGPDGSIAPLMGNSYDATRSLWWYGTSTSDTTFQDDMAVIARPANTFGYRADDHGDAAGTATQLVNQGSPLVAAGIIETTADEDYFAFDTTGGTVSLSVSVPASINDLDSQLELISTTGLIAPILAAPGSSFGASITTSVPGGSYLAVVRSQGGYGDVGEYTLTVSAPQVPVTPAVVAPLFYNQSAFDGNNAGAGPADDAAIATDKFAYFPGEGSIAPANMSSYARGINGLIIDVEGFGGPITASDFTFRTSEMSLAANNAPGTWSLAPTPQQFVVRPGAGQGGSDRVEFIWPDGAIVNRYLQVVVEGNDAAGSFNTNTGLAESDVFFFGSKVGDTFAGTPEAFFATAGSDEVDTRVNFQGGVSITSPYDFDRNGVAGNANDQFVARSSFGLLWRINIAEDAFAPPAAPLASAAGVEQIETLARTLSAEPNEVNAGVVDAGDASPRVAAKASAAAMALVRSQLPRVAAGRTDVSQWAVRESEPPAPTPGGEANQAIRRARELSLAMNDGDLAERPAVDDELLDELVADLLA